LEPLSPLLNSKENRLKITETFFSLQGEGTHAGLPCSFIRLTGCPLRCVYCDTAYAFHGGAWKSFDDLLNYLEAQTSRLVQITGGEPLAQKAVIPFIDLLCKKGFSVLLETSGALSLKGINRKCCIVMDLKTPGSGEVQRNLWENLNLLKDDDEVKFVLTSLSDWKWTEEQVRIHRLDERFNVLISLTPEAEHLRVQIADAIIASGRNLRFQIQLHKIIWGEQTGK